MDPLTLVDLTRTLVDIDSTTGVEGDCGRRVGRVEQPHPGEDQLRDRLGRNQPPRFGDQIVVELNRPKALVVLEETGEVVLEPRARVGIVPVGFLPFEVGQRAEVIAIEMLGHAEHEVRLEVVIDGDRLGRLPKALREAISHLRQERRVQLS